MSQREREQFDLVLEFNDELREFTVGLAEVGVAVTLATQRLETVGSSPTLKGRILDKIRDRPQHVSPEPLVVSGPDGLVRWVNSAFTAMCGYSLEELRGKSLGPILQGEKTDPATADRMRQAVRQGRSCHEKILNYRKNKEPYWVEIAITPIADESGQPRWLIAREREFADQIPA
jgi:PAS domain S-box-containing protein